MLGSVRRPLKIFGRGRALVALAVLTLTVASCRQILGLDQTPPLRGAGGSAGAGQGGAAGAMGAGGADAGSPFSVVHGVPQGETLFGVWTPDTHFTIAVGTSSIAFVIRDGAITQLGGNQKGRDYLGVAGFAPDDVYIVGTSASGTGFVDHYDGTGITEQFEAPVALLSVWAGIDTGHKFVMAGGIKGQVFGLHEGQAWAHLWNLTKGPNDPKLPEAPRIWGTAGRNLDDFGYVSDGRVWHWEPDAGGLAYYDLEMAKNTQFHAAWQSPDPPTSIYYGTNFGGLVWFSAAVNGDTAPLSVVLRDETLPAGDKIFMQGVWGTREKVVAVGDQGRIYVYDPGVSAGHFVPSPTDDTLGSVWGSSLKDVWIVGQRELILHGALQ